MGHENGGWMNDDQRAVVKDAAEARGLKVGALLAACKEAVELIEFYHGPAGWPEYQHSPEMKRIRAAIKAIDHRPSTVNL